jgi:competence protein CoiA
MPLSATVDGELLCAPLVPDGLWEDLRGARVTLQPCGHRGFARVSPLGTRHFVHERDCDCHHPESAEHLHMKAVVARAVAAAGWQAATEVPGAGFVADVLARRGDATVAVEVQRSRQVLQRYRERQATYQSQGIRAVWLVRTVPAGHLTGPDLPLFLVEDWLGEGSAIVMGRAVAVPRLIAALLSGQCRWRSEVVTSHCSAQMVRVVCPVCGRAREVLLAQWREGTCACGLPVVSADPGREWQHQRCCGYWGTALGLGLRGARRVQEGRVAHGHWCLTA